MSCVSALCAHKPGVYISTVTWPWRAWATVWAGLPGRGKKGRPLFTAAAAVAFGQWKSGAHRSLPAAPIHSAACCLFTALPSSFPSSLTPWPPTHHFHLQKYTSLLKQCIAWRCQRGLPGPFSSWENQLPLQPLKMFFSLKWLAIWEENRFLSYPLKNKRHYLNLYLKQERRNMQALIYVSIRLLLMKQPLASFALPPISELILKDLFAFKLYNATAILSKWTSRESHTQARLGIFASLLLKNTC